MNDQSHPNTGESTVDCPGCGAPAGHPPAGPCRDHGTPEATTRDLCPMGCGNLTDDVAGGPCTDCWNEVL